MYRFFVLVCLSASLFLSANSQTNPANTCEVRQPSKDVRNAIRDWFESSNISRAWQGSADLQAMLDDPQINCRDQIELKRAFYVLDTRDKSSSTSISSAEFILDNPDWFDPTHRGQAVLFLLDAYKSEKRYPDLMDLAQRPVVKEHSYTLIPARDAYVLSSYALQGTAQTLEMLRPFADAPVNAKDWWLMHFANALAERSGERELADAFLNKADRLFTPPRTFELPADLEGDKAEKMLAAASSPTPAQTGDWVMSRLPKPNYPKAALRRGESGVCEVVFDISVEGKPENVRPYCSSRLFSDSARRAMGRVRFENRGDAPQPVKNVSYPLEYSVGRSR